MPDLTGRRLGLPPRARGKFAADPLGFLLRGHAEFGPVFTTSLDGAPTAIVGTAAGVGELFAREREQLKISNTALVHDLFGRCIFNLTGPAHGRARRMLRVGLAGAALTSYVSPLLHSTEVSVRQWAGYPHAHLHAAAQALTLRMSAITILGILPQDAADAEMLRGAFGVFVAATGAPGGRGRYGAPRYWAGLSARRALHELFARRVALRLAEPGSDALSHLARPWQGAGSELGELGDHLLALLIAARETTASLITWYLIELAERPGLAERAAGEARQVTAEPTLLLQRGALPVLRAVLAETQRLHSPNMISVREAVRPVEIGGFTVPAGWHVAYSPSANHFDPGCFSDPLQFRPERFAAGGHSTAALLAFGGGVHACLGKPLAELMTLACAVSVLARWRIRLPQGRPHHVRYLPVKAPRRPVPVVLYPA